MQTACAQNRAWQAAGLPPIRITVNLSARQFEQQNLPKLIHSVLSETGLDAQYLEVEITESIAMQDIPVTIAVLEALQAMGVSISIDDFGTGYSSLATLKRFPLNTLKIDREFVKDLTTNAKDAALVRAIVALGHGLALTVIAEGVETLDQQAFLGSVGCDAMQGFLFSKPLPAAAVAQLYQNTVHRDG
jgi:EAL domain-containing protein (putative c-di-GMP-specific phosphodiesterase class I)